MITSYHKGNQECARILSSDSNYGTNMLINFDAMKKSRFFNAISHEVLNMPMIPS